MFVKKKWLMAIRILILLTLIFIWGNSFLPAEVSGALSEWLFGLLRGARAVTAKIAEQGWLTEARLRKLMHGTEFMMLGLLVSLEWQLRDRKSLRQFLLCLLTGLAAASCDEFIQIFNTRFASPKDICIDFGGFLTGSLLIWGIGLWRRQSRRLK